MPSKDDIDIMVITREMLFYRGAYFNGFMSVLDAKADYEQRVNKLHKFMRRGDAENNTEYKQPIPFVVPIKRREGKVFTSEYGGHEGRLIKKITIASMGHIEKCDTYGSNLLLEAAKREFFEELTVTGIDNPERKLVPVPFGYINVEDDATGKFHFGFAYLILADGFEIKAREDSIINPKFMHVRNLEEKCKSGEVDLCSWSKATLPKLISYLGC